MDEYGLSAPRRNRVDVFRELIVEIERRAAQRAIAVERARFLGSKRDLLTIFRKVLGMDVSEASMEEYMRSLGVKFPRARLDHSLRALFSEHF